MPSRETFTPQHESHDRVLVARFAAGDAYATEINDAQQLIDSCPECAALASDIRLISARTSELREVRRPRDFRISPEQAERLRGSWLDRLMRGIAAPGWTVVRPLAGAAFAIALVFVVIGALPLNNLRGGTVREAAPAGAPVAGSTDAGGFAAQATAQIVSDKAATATVSDTSFYAPTLAAPVGRASGAPDPGSLETDIPDAGMSTSSEEPPGLTTEPEAEGSSGESAPPENSVAETVAPGFGGQIGGGVTAQPSDAPAALVATGDANVPVANEATIDRTAFVAGGLLLGFVAVMALAAAWLIRRRYSDPLVE